MYNTKFLPQIEKFRKDLFGTSTLDTRGASPEQYGRYFPPPNVRFIECYKDKNGEWVPKSENSNCQKD